VRTLVLGVGNSILSDDAVGLVVARRLEERFGGRGDTDFGYNEEAGFTLLEESLGYDRLVVIDSILTGSPAGTVHRLDLGDLGRSIHSNSPHGMNLATVMALGKTQAMDVPDDVRIYAIEVIDTLTFGEDLTPELKERVDSVVAEIAAEVFSDAEVVRGCTGEDA
jgi:hydrogenase maturation protease